ncbi:MAG TPA: DUF1592 domain-containing protein, partial [Polyangiaceae bacterium]
MRAQRLWRSSPAWWGLLCGGIVAACTGSFGDAVGGPGANGSQPGAGGVSGTVGAGGSQGSSGTTGTAGTAGNAGSAGSAGTAGAGGGGPSISVVGPTVAENAGQLIMRRLTYREYDHMMNVLLGDTTFPASGIDGWSPDAPANTGFVSPNTVASYHVIQYNQTASTLVDAAIKAMAAGQKTGKFVLPAGCTAPTAAQEASCATKFVSAFGLEAFRRPVGADEQADLLTLFTTVRTTDSFSFVDSIGTIAKAMLQSPNFLYHWELGPTKPVAGTDGLLPLTPWQTASRLAMALWESMPDDTLLTAAQSNQLSTAEQVAAQASRMLADPQAAQSLYSFHLQWIFNMGFHVTDLSTIVGKPNSPLTDLAAQGLQTEFTQFISSVYSPPGDGTLNTLYTAPYAFVNKDLAAIYGVAGPATGFAKVNLDPAQRAGIFTQVAFLAGIQDSVADNPVYRGLAIYTKALCGTIGGPPANVPSVNFMSGGTTRQAYDAHGSSACASGCHGLFDPPGFAFENYDGAGRYRTMDGTQPVDATGTFASPLQGAGATATTFTFSDGVEFVKQLAASPEAQACVARQWTRYMLG